MARYSRVFRMFIASPSDTAIHRQAVYKASYRWNAVNSVESEVFVEPVGWEYHVRQESNPSGGQDSIDTQLLNSSDFLIGIFHSKPGKSVAGGKSGTIHEIERFNEVSNRSMIFFSNEKLDPNTSTDDLEALRKFGASGFSMGKDRAPRSGSRWPS